MDKRQTEEKEEELQLAFNKQRIDGNFLLAVTQVQQTEALMKGNDRTTDWLRRKRLFRTVVF